MTALICDICGGKLKVSKGKIAVCDSCGMEHSVERVREIIREVKGTIHVDHSHLVDNFYRMALDAYKTDNNAEAERYCNRILEIYPKHIEANFLKGKSVGWQSNLSNFRFNEAAICFVNAVNSSDDEVAKQKMNESVEEEFEKLAAALVSARNKRFFMWPDQKESAGFCNDLDEIATAIDNYIIQTGIQISKNRVFSNVAFSVKLNMSAVISTRILSEFKSDGSRNSYRTFVNRIDNCIRILEKTAALCDNDDESDMQIYKLVISMLEAIIRCNTNDFIKDKWGAYKEIPRLSNIEVQERKVQIKKFEQIVVETKKQ